MKLEANNLSTNDKLFSDFATQKRDYSENNTKDNTISELTPKCCNSSAVNETTHIPNSVFASNSLTNHSNKSSNFKRIAQSFCNHVNEVSI